MILIGAWTVLGLLVGGLLSRLASAISERHGLAALAGRCPRCGEGPLFRRWIDSYERCPVCGLLYQRNHGDLWIWLILTDRIPMLVGIVAMVFLVPPLRP